MGIVFFFFEVYVNVIIVITVIAIILITVVTVIIFIINVIIITTSIPIDATKIIPTKLKIFTKLDTTNSNYQILTTPTTKSNSTTN